MKFSERLKFARIENKLTQLQVAKTLGITEGAYCSYEKGKREPNVEKIKLLANLFNVSADFLLNTNKYNKEATLNSTEEKLLKLFRELNNKGQNKLLDSADDLVSSKKYEIVATEENPISQNNEITATRENPEREIWEKEANEFAAKAREHFISEKRRESETSFAKKSDVG